MTTVRRRTDPSGTTTGTAPTPTPQIDPGRITRGTVTLPATNTPPTYAPPRTSATSGGSTPADPYNTLAALFAATFGMGAGSGASGNDQLAAQVVPVGTGASSGGPNVTGLLVLGLLGVGGWYWWRHRKGAAHA